MKKILVALALVLALALTFVGCEEKSGADYVIEGFENLVADVEAKQITEPVRLSFSVEDITKLCSMLGVDMTGVPTLKNAFMDMYMSPTLGKADIGVTLDDKPLNLALLGDGNSIVLTSEQLSKDYGCTVAELCTLLENLLDVKIELSETMTAYNDPAKVEAIEVRYGEKLETLVRENIEFTTEKDGKNVLVSFVLTPENFTEIFYTMYTDFKADAELQEWLEDSNIDIDIEFGDMTKEEMLSGLTDAQFSGDVKMTIVKKTSEIVAVDATLTADEEPLTMQYAETADGFTATVKVEENVAEIVLKATEETCSFMMQVTEDGTEVADVEFSFAEDISFSATMEGTTVGANFDYTVDKNRFEMLLREVSMGGITLDLSEIGIKMLVETGVEAPTMPTEYTSVANYTAEDLQTILIEFVMGAGLLKYFM